MHECRSSLLLSLKHDWNNRRALQTLIGSYIAPGLLNRFRRWKNSLREVNFGAGVLRSDVSTARAPELTSVAIKNGKTGRI
jgi:hypothetical protein